ncbi:hypothetical protein [Brevibacillus porteri]|uniref:hypothetical protein n=1 Tax=Brevibacillus porteri TaxID=2126350 RepID=UPI003D1945FA
MVVRKSKRGWRHFRADHGLLSVFFPEEVIDFVFGWHANLPESAYTVIPTVNKQLAAQLVPSHNGCQKTGSILYNRERSSGKQERNRGFGFRKGLSSRQSFFD